MSSERLYACAFAIGVAFASAGGCGGDDDHPSDAANVADAPAGESDAAAGADAPPNAIDATATDATATDATLTTDASATDASPADAAPAVDAVPIIDAVVADAAPDAHPGCAAAGSFGEFPDCSVCTAFGRDCDTIDVGGSTSRHCDCATSEDCPCELRCGSREIAPGISVSGICVR